MSSHKGDLRTKKIKVESTRPNSPNTLLVNKTRAKRSQLWKYFTEVGNKRAKCGFCTQSLSFQHGSTQNLARHLRIMHRSLVLLTNHDKPKKTVINSGGQSGYPKTDQINKQLVLMIVKELHSVSLVGGIEFKNFVGMLNPKYKLPTEQNLLNRLIPQYYQYNDVLNTVKREIEHAPIVSLALDEWKSVVNETNYVSVTAYFINDQTEQKAYLLECFPSYDDKHLYNELCRVIASWHLEEKVCAIVTADKPVMIKTVEHGHWDHVKCAAEKIDTFVNKFLVMNESLRIKVQTICKEANLIKLKLKPDWNETYELFTTYLNSRTEISKTVRVLSPSEDDEIVNACTILKIFKEIVEEISRDKIVPLSKILVLIESYKRIIERIIERMPNLANLLSVFQDISENQLRCEAALLDPRFKQHAFIGNANYASIVQVAALRATEFGLLNTPILETPETKQPVNKERSLIWEEFDSEFASKEDHKAIPLVGSVEMDKYLMEPYIDRTSDPLLWWKSRKNVYPYLYQLVLRRLCIPGTAVLTAFSFTKAGQILAERRSRLSADEIQTLMFLYYNTENRDLLGN